MAIFGVFSALLPLNLERIACHAIPIIHLSTAAGHCKQWVRGHWAALRVAWDWDLADAAQHRSPIAVN